MNEQQRKQWLPLGLLAGALVIWAGLLALGSFLQLGSDRPRYDIRQPLIVLASMGLFLAFWGSALWLRSRRK